MSVRPGSLAVLLAGALLGCGGEAAPPVFVVVDRPAELSVSGREGAALTRTWEFDGGPPGWVVPAAAAADAAAAPEGGPEGPAPGAPPADGALHLAGTGRITLVGPFEGTAAGAGPPPPALDPEIHHWLTLRLATTTARTLTIGWRAAGQAFDGGRATSPIALHPDGEWHTYSLPTSELRGSEHAADGVEAFLLRFDGPGEIAVDLDQIALVSDHDAPARGLRALTRDGVLRRGASVALPGRVAFTLDARPGDRLALALALVGADAPARVHVEGHDGRALSPPLDVDPGAAWLERELALPDDLPPGPLDVTLRGGDGAGPHATLLVGSLLHLRASDRGPAATGPDVLLYVVDTLRADRLGLHGHDRPTDPALAAMARDGAVFEQVLAASNWTRPSMSSLMTSLPPPAHGNQVHGTRVPEAAVTLAEAFAASGWRTAACITNFHAGDWAGLAQGFDVHFGPRWRGAYRLQSTQTSDVVADWLDDELERGAHVRTFLVVLSLDPHAPYEPSAEDLAAVGGAPRRTPGVDGAPAADPSLAYDAEIRHNDDNLGRLDATLARLGRRDDLLLAVTADHGEAFGEHGQHEHRRSLHQEEVRVPWIVRWPGRVTAGARLAQPVGHVDVAPTLLGLAGLDAPAGWEGRDLSAWLRGRGAPPPPDRPLFSDAVYLPEDRPEHPHELAVVVAPYKLITRVHADGRVLPHRLYDLAADPGETTDLLRDPARAAVVEGLLAQARDLIERGRVLPESGSVAADMDPLMRRWMAEMGYLK